MAGSTPPLPKDDRIERVDEARVYGRHEETGEFIGVPINDDGELKTASEVEVADTVDVADRGGRALGEIAFAAGDISPIVASTTSAGEDAAAVIEPGALRTTVDRHVDVDASGTVVVEGRHPGRSWRIIEEIDVEAGTTTEAITTSYPEVRMYATDMGDSDVNVLELSAGGL